MYSPARNLKADNKLPTLVLKKLFGWAIYYPCPKYLLKGLKTLASLGRRAKILREDLTS